MLPIPFDYLDKICMAASSREHGISSAPVWQLHVEGEFDEEVGALAIQALARRFPVVVSKAVSLHRGGSVQQARKLAYQPESPPDMGRLFNIVDLTDSPADFPAVQQRIFDNFMDLEQDYPVRITWVRRSASSGVLMMQQHHGIADGRAFFGLIGTLCRYYDAVLQGTLPRSIQPMAKLAEATVAEPSRWKRLLFRFPGTLMHIRNLVRYAFHPPDQLVSNLATDFTGHNQVIHHDVDTDLVRRIRGLKAASGHSTNDILTTAMALSLASWSEEQQHPVRWFNLLIPADIRPRNWSLESFANHLSSFLVDLDLRRYGDPLALLGSVHEQIRKQASRRAPLKKVLAEIAVAKMVSLARVRKAVFAPQRTILNFPFSNLVSLSPPDGEDRFFTSRWSAEQLRIMTPCAWLQGANTTVIKYNGQLSFNFNHTQSSVTTPLAQRLVSHYDLALMDLVDRLAGSRRSAE